MTPEEWIGSLISMAVTSTLTVLLMQVIKKYDPNERVRRWRLIIVAGASAFSALVVFMMGVFPVNHLPFQITAGFTLTALFHSMIFNAVKKKVKDKIDER